uniref:Lck interacting transmembrane adaptor 1 n=1 Tax=Propithecus coquereli TaxID=379532 RepID=A0A2K6G1U3_PROCO
MGLRVPSAPPALWVLGCCALLLWLWALCTACALPPWPDHALAPRKRARRPWAGLQGSMMPAEAVRPGRGWLGTDLHALPPGTAATDPAPLPQQVRHQTARAACRSAGLQSPAACQHGSPSPPLARDVQGPPQAAGSHLCLPEQRAAPGPTCCHTHHGPHGHLLQRGAGDLPQGWPGSQPCGRHRAGPPRTAGK